MQIVHTLSLGGSERLACDLATRSRAAGVRPSVCALDIGGPFTMELARAGVPYWVMRRRAGFDWRLIPRIFRLVLRYRPAVVQTHHLTPLIYAALGARAAGARIVHVEHEHFTFGRPRAVRRLRRLSRLCDRVVAAGEGVGEFLAEEVGVSRKRLQVIRNGVDVGLYSPVARRPRSSAGLDDGDRVIGHVARLAPEKDQATLLRAVARLMPGRPKLRLLIVGEGVQAGELRELARTLGIAGRVCFAGARSDVRDLLPLVDVFALSSVREGLPLTVLEAMACGRPVVATDVGELAAAVVPGVTGWLVPPSDPPALADALAAVVDDCGRAEAMGQAARVRVEAEFSLERTVREYERVWTHVGRAGMLGRGARKPRRGARKRRDGAGPRPDGGGRR
jgi:sugar transferase (PEP-CTERM/EpsH1 system associated)